MLDLGKNEIKDYVEGVVFETTKRQRNGFGEKIIVLVGQEQAYLSGMKVLNFKKGKYSGTNSLSAAETFELIGRHKYEMKKCLSIDEVLRLT